MKARSVIVCCALLTWTVGVPGLVAQAPKTKQGLSGDEIKKALIESPTPPYPRAYRARRLEGAGSFWLQFNTKTGHVDAVKILQSTGHTELDNVAVSTFYRWRCRPGDLHQITVPASFTLDHSHRGVGVHLY